MFDIGDPDLRDQYVFCVAREDLPANSDLNITLGGEAALGESKWHTQDQEIKKGQFFWAKKDGWNGN